MRAFFALAMWVGNCVAVAAQPLVNLVVDLKGCW